MHPLDIETSIVGGPPGAAFVALSDHAEMICVGSVGIGRYAESILGSTAAELAEQATCPVAVIRPTGEANGHGRAENWIIVAVKDEPGNQAVVDRAMQEAALRQAPVLALGEATETVSARSLDDDVRRLRQRYPGVHVYPIANRADVTHFLRKHRERVQLAVIGSSDAG